MKRKSLWGVFLSAVIAFAGVFAQGVLLDFAVVYAEEQTEEIASPRVEDGATTWDLVRFGSYYQEAEYNENPIKWRILDIDNSGNALLLADKILDAQRYNNSDVTTTWAECSLNAWLDDEFYNAAFNQAEQDQVISTTVTTADNGTASGGDASTDKVWLLSIDEAATSSYGFVGYDEESERITEFTDYVLGNDEIYQHLKSWWLRSPSQDNGSAASLIRYDGMISGYHSVGTSVNVCCGVRPAIRINLNTAASLISDAGTVDSVGNTGSGDGIYGNPERNNNVSTWDCIYFGRYNQTIAATEKPIEWRVLSVDTDNNTAFLLSDKILDNQYFHTEDAYVNWKTCSLKTWLNDTFYHAAFSDAEKAAVKSHDTEEYGKLYLLSTEEVDDAAYGFEGYSTAQGVAYTRYALVTEYAASQGAYVSAGDNAYKGCGRWFVRYSGSDLSRYIPGYVRENGDDFRSGSNKPAVNSMKYGVRPSMKVDLTKAELTKAGTVTASASGLSYEYIQNESESEGDNNNTNTDTETDTNTNTNTDTDTNTETNSNSSTNTNTNTDIPAQSEPLVYELGTSDSLLAPTTVAKSAVTFTNTSKTFKASKLKSKSRSYSIIAASGGGTVTAKYLKNGKISAKTCKKYISVSKKGKVTVKKGAKKGIYKVKVTVAAKGDFKKTSMTIRIKIK